MSVVPSRNSLIKRRIGGSQRLIDPEGFSLRT
jgi:hypothetical protein